MASGELAPEFVDAGWGAIDLQDAYMVIEDVLGYMDDAGYLGPPSVLPPMPTRMPGRRRRRREPRPQPIRNALRRVARRISRRLFGR